MCSFIADPNVPKESSSRTSSRVSHPLCLALRPSRALEDRSCADAAEAATVAAAQDVVVASCGTLAGAAA